jgi:hypothetical protein
MGVRNLSPGDTTILPLHAVAKLHVGLTGIHFGVEGELHLKQPIMLPQDKGGIGRSVPSYV